MTENPLGRKYGSSKLNQYYSFPNIRVTNEKFRVPSCWQMGLDLNFHLRQNVAATMKVYDVFSRIYHSSIDRKSRDNKIRGSHTIPVYMQLNLLSFANVDSDPFTLKDIQGFTKKYMLTKLIWLTKIGKKASGWLRYWIIHFFRSIFTGTSEWKNGFRFCLFVSFLNAKGKYRRLNQILIKH